MPLLFKSRSRRISACRPWGCFSLGGTRSKQRHPSTGKAGASPTWLHCAACRLLLLESLSFAHVLQPSSITMSPAQFLLLVATYTFISFLPFCFAACLPLPTFPHSLHFTLYLNYFTSFSLSTMLPSVCYTTSMCTSHTPPWCLFSPASLHPALSACLSFGKPCFLSPSSLPELIWLIQANI